MKEENGLIPTQLFSIGTPFEIKVVNSIDTMLNSIFTSQASTSPDKQKLREHIAKIIFEYEKNGTVNFIISKHP